MSKFLGPRSGSTTVDGYVQTDHGLLIGLADDDHLDYLITSSIRTVAAPISGIDKIGTTSGDVFSLINAGSGASLYIQQTGTTSDADAAVDIVNTGNTGRGLSVFTSTVDPSLPLVQFSALSSSFDEAVLFVTHNNPRGLALDVRGDGYLSGVLSGPMALTFTGLNSNPIELGETGIYSEVDTFYFVDSSGVKHTFSLDEKVKVSSNDTTSDFLFDKLVAGANVTITELADGGDESILISSTASGSATDAYVDAGCNLNIVLRPDGYKEFSLDIQSIAGEGLVVGPTASGCPELRVDLDAYQVGYDDSGNSFIFATNVQDAISEIDGYLVRGRVRHIRKLGSEADDSPFNSVFGTDGYEYPVDEDRIMVFINGVAQFNPVDFVERSTTTVEMSEPRDRDDVIDILILPGSLGTGTSTTDLQSAYDNSASGVKSVLLGDGQITFTQLQSSGSALRLISSGSVTPTLVADQSGSGEAVRIKSVDEVSASLLVQKDTASRNTIVNTAIVERTTSNVIGGLTGIGSAFLTRLESSGSTLFGASRIVTGTESASDSIEKTFLSFEVSDDGILTEHARITSTGSFGIQTSTPEATLHVQGDGYLSQGLEVAGQITVHNTPNAPLHLPVLTDAPPILTNGDVWVSDIGGSRRINARIGGVTYSSVMT